MASSRPLISVILATRNEVHNLPRLLQSIEHQTYPHHEVIVIDNSPDNLTQQTARKAGVKHVYQLKAQKTTLNFRGQQVNQGVAKAKGDLIFFPDADMTFDPHLLAEIAQLSTHYDALYIPEIVIGKGYFGRVRRFERSFYNMTPIDAVRVIKKNLFQKIGGFDEKNIAFGADDWDLNIRVKQVTDKIGITQSPLYHHEDGLNWKTYIQKKRLYKDCFDGYLRKWGANHPTVKQQLSLPYRAWGVFVENGKWKKLITHPHLAAGMCALRLVTWLDYRYEKTA